MTEVKEHRPTNQLGATGLGGAVAIVLMWIVTETTGISLPEHVAGAITLLMGVVAGHFADGIGRKRKRVRGQATFQVQRTMGAPTVIANPDGETRDTWKQQGSKLVDTEWLRAGRSEIADDAPMKQPPRECGSRTKRTDDKAEQRVESLTGRRGRPDHGRFARTGSRIGLAAGMPPPESCRTSAHRGIDWTHCRRPAVVETGARPQRREIITWQ